MRWLLLLCAGCTQSGTGVLLTVDGPTVDRLMITASNNVTKDIPVARPLPATLLAELPDDVGEVSFHVEGFAGNSKVGEGDTPKTSVPAHHVISLSVQLSSASDDMLHLDLQSSPFTVRRGGQAGLFTGVWASASEVYVTSRSISGNDLLHASGGDFTAQHVASGLNAVWGASPSTVFLVGPGGSLYKGSDTTWTLQTTPAGSVEFFGVWGSSATDVYVVGGSNSIVHNGGGGWVLQTALGTTELHAVGGTAGSIYAVGSGGVILHSTGNGAWTPEQSGTQANLWGVFAGFGKVYVVGDGGTVLVSSGSGWSPETASGGLAGIWGSSATDLWAAGESAFRSTGNGTWTPLGTPARLTAIFGTGANDVWLVGDQQTILHHP